MPPESILAELKRLEKHSEWLNNLEEPKPHKKGEAPPSRGFKDCGNCPTRYDYDTPGEREEFCSKSCPFALLPVGPSQRLLKAMLWSRMPDGIFFVHGRDLSVQDWTDLGDVKSYIQARR